MAHVSLKSFMDRMRKEQPAVRVDNIEIGIDNEGMFFITLYYTFCSINLPKEGVNNYTKNRYFTRFFSIIGATDMRKNMEDVFFDSFATHLNGLGVKIGTKITTNQKGA